MTESIPTPEFSAPRDMGPRSWGTETLIALSPGKYSLKHLFVKAGSRGGLQYHHFKDESAFLVSGTMLLRYDDGSGKLVEKVVGSGASFRFPPGSVHQEEAITDCVLIEASTPHANDRVRMEDVYGIDAGDDNSLPSTCPDEVILLM
jgi:mannose-6-phosphate isomerase-like protein (cupin superfamily)